MNRYLRAIIEVPCGLLKLFLVKVAHGKKASIKFVSAISPFAELTVDNKAVITIGSRYRQRSFSHVRVRKGAELVIGSNVSINHGCMIVSHCKIKVGNDVQFSPNVMIYDHDHDYSTKNGIKDMCYKETPIIIGDNVWIGANTVILRGSKIGNNVVIAAGSIVKGDIPDNTIFIQKRDIIYKDINKND